LHFRFLVTFLRYFLVKYSVGLFCSNEIDLDKQDGGLCIGMHATHSIGLPSQLGGKTDATFGAEIFTSVFLCCKVIVADSSCKS
jgi:hypothetical protein